MLGHYFHRIILIYSSTPCEQCCARDYIHHGSATSGTKRGASEPASSIPSPPRNRNEATPCTAGPHRDEGRLLIYIGTLYTIRVRMTVVYVELKPFALQWGLRLLYICRELCVAKRRIIMISMTWLGTRRAQTLDRAHLSHALQPDFYGRTMQFTSICDLTPAFFPVGRWFGTSRPIHISMRATGHDRGRS